MPTRPTPFAPMSIPPIDPDTATGAVNATSSLRLSKPFAQVAEVRACYAPSARGIRTGVAGEECEGQAWIDATLREVRAKLARQSRALSNLGVVSPEVGISGKLLRPRLLLIVAATVADRAPSGDRAASLATAVELIHLATLHHDDVLDESPRRRRAASAREMVGNKVSILLGDALVASAFGIFLRSASQRMQLGVIRALTATVRGEIEQHLRHRMLEVGDAECLHVARLKTGSLFALSAQVGALLGGLDPGQAADAHRFGRRLGTAYQLIDDALDYAGDEGDLGKPAGADYRQGIATLPLVRAWRAASAQERKLLRAGFGQDEAGHFAAVRDIVLRTRPFESSLALARRELEMARLDLTTLWPGRERRLLTAYVDEIARRVPQRRPVPPITDSVG